MKKATHSWKLMSPCKNITRDQGKKTNPEKKQNPGPGGLLALIYVFVLGFALILFQTRVWVELLLFFKNPCNKINRDQSKKKKGTLAKNKTLDSVGFLL